MVPAEKVTAHQSLDCEFMEGMLGTCSPPVAYPGDGHLHFLHTCFHENSNCNLSSCGPYVQATLSPWMSARRASAQLSQDLTSTARTDLKPDLIRLAESYLQRFLGWFFHLFLQTFNELQDALLAISPLRRLVAFALAPRCGPTVQAQIQDGSNL